MDEEKLSTAEGTVGTNPAPAFPETPVSAEPNEPPEAPESEKETAGAVDPTAEGEGVVMGADLGSGDDRTVTYPPLADPKPATDAEQPEQRILHIGTRHYTQVVCTDQPGAGGACHEYLVTEVPAEPGAEARVFVDVSFQNGPVQEAGVNGCHNEDLLAIVIDRLEHFQKGAYACEENDLALKYARRCLSMLGARTRARRQQNVEGTNQPHQPEQSPAPKD